MPTRVTAGTAALLLLTALGCGPDQPALAPVRGKVYYRGTPLAAGTIVFIPDERRGTEGPLARGDIQPDGSYTLRTDNAPGAVPGWHRVTILAVQVPPGAAGGPPAAPRSLLPPRYRDPELSGLSCQVRPGQENTHDFNLD